MTSWTRRFFKSSENLSNLPRRQFVASALPFSLLGLLGAQKSMAASSTSVSSSSAVNIRDFGAVGNNSTDDTAAIQAAINHASSLKGSARRALYIPAGSYAITSLVIPPSGTHLTIFGDGNDVSRLRSTPTTAGIVIDCQAEAVRFKDMGLSNADFETDKVKRIGIRFQRPSGSPADTDAELSSVYINEFYIGVDHYGRGLKVQDCIFSICTYCINLNWGVQPEGKEYVQKDLTGFRAFQISNNRFHSFGTAAVRNEGPGAEKINGVLITNNLLDIGRSLFDGALCDALVDGNMVQMTPAAALNLSNGSHDYVVSNMVIAGDNSGLKAKTPYGGRWPPHFINLTGNHRNGVFRNLQLRNNREHGINIRNGKVSHMVFENISFVDPCQNGEGFAPIAFVGDGHSAVIRNITIATANPLIAAVRVTESSGSVAIHDVQIFGPMFPKSIK